MLKHKKYKFWRKFIFFSFIWQGKTVLWTFLTLSFEIFLMYCNTMPGKLFMYVLNKYRYFIILLIYCERCKKTKLYSENWRIFIQQVSQIFCLNLHRFVNKHLHRLMIFLWQYIFETVTASFFGSHKSPKTRKRT